MTKMIPPYVSKDVKSNAERKIFGMVHDSEELAGYTCLHSLGISRHLRKRQGEIDFVLVGNGVILCLEVKGGRVARKDGIWRFIDRYGQENIKTESPFIQASSGMFSLKNDLEAKFGATHGYMFGYGVLFPDFEFKESSPEWDRSIVYDSRDTSRPFSKYIERLSRFWREKTPHIPNKGFLPKQEVVNYLRGDFEFATRLWSDISRTEEEINYFTNEQYRALDQMENNPRVIFTGAAGAGKTLLAVEKARRMQYAKQKTLLLCFNRLLGVRLQNEARRIDPMGVFLHANSIHKYFTGVIEKAGLAGSLNRQSAAKNPQEFYNELLPSVFASIVEKDQNGKYDCLVIDEGQDLLNENYLLALDSVLKGGFKQGCWAVFLDPGGQAKLFNRFSLEAYEFLKSLGAPEYKLDLNVRNTVQIAMQASIVSGFPAGKTRVEGPKVEYKMCASETDMALRVVELINNLLGKESVPPQSITILSSRNTGSMSLFATGVKTPRCLIEASEENISSLPKGGMLYASAQSFKGLENNIIIYTDLDSFNGRFSESVNYVAMTRAREKLYVFMDKKLNNEYQERVRNFVNIKT